MAGWEDDPVVEAPRAQAPKAPWESDPVVRGTKPATPAEVPSFARPELAPQTNGERATTLAAPTAPVSPSGAFLQSHHDAELAARQGVNPNALSKYFPSSPENKPAKLGDMEEMDWGPTYKGPTGEYLRINPKTDFIARDPETGRMGVYARNAQTDENRAVSASRLMMPGLAVGPVTNSIRAVPEAAEMASQALSHSSAAPPASVLAANRLPQGAIGSPVGADLAASRAGEAAADAEAFRRANVRPPPIAFMQGPMAQVGKQISEIPFVGAPIKNSLDESLKGLATATENLASRYGSATTPETAGSAIQQGIERFRDARPADIVERAMEGYTPEQLSQIIAAPARDTSMKTKQAALYQDAWSYVPQDMKAGRTEATLPRFLGDMGETRGVVNQIVERNLGMMNKARAQRMSVADENAAMLPTRGQAIPKVAMPVQGGMLGQIVSDIAAGNWRGTLQNMRDVRSDIRRLASGMADTEKNTLKISDIERIQSSVTRDMVHLLQRNADEYRNLAVQARNGQDHTTAAQYMKVAADTERAINKFKRADQFTRLSAERMERIERLFSAPSAESLYRNIMSAALSKGKGDLQKLRILGKTLRPEEMNDVGAAVIRQLGEPIGSARGSVQEIGFSPSSALTRWNNMSPEARSLILGHDHAQALDDWFRITNRLANVEALANTSRSGTHLTNALIGIGSAGMALNGHTALLGTALTAGGGLSLLLSRPAYVRWVIKYAQLRAAALRAPVNSTAPRMAVLVNQLGQMATKDPQLLPMVHAIAAENRVGERRDQNQPIQGQPRLH